MESANKDFNLFMGLSAGGKYEVFQRWKAKGCWLGWGWRVMGRGCLVWRQMVWEACPRPPSSPLGRADGVWGGSQWLLRRGGSGRWDAGSLPGAVWGDQ